MSEDLYRTLTEIVRRNRASVRATLERALTAGAEQRAAIAAAATQISRAASKSVDAAVQVIGVVTDALLRDWGRWAPGLGTTNCTFGGMKRATVDDGLPAVWVSTADLLSSYEHSTTREERMHHLMSQRSQIIELLRQRLDECSAAELDEYVDFAHECLDALDDMPRASLALAVNCIEALSFELIGRHEEVLAATKFDEEVGLLELRQAFVWAPLNRMYQHWSPSKRVVAPVPGSLLRHGVAHGGPASGQYTPENALLAAMLLVSLLRELQEGVRSSHFDPLPLALEPKQTITIAHADSVMITPTSY